MNEILLGPEQQRWPRRAFFKRMIWNAACSCALGGLFAWRLEDYWLRIEKRQMPLRGLGNQFDGATLAHVSDLHCSPIVLEQYLHQCVDEINSLDVDFVAITGDFITGPKPYARRVARIVGRLRPRIASVACLGNHDYGMLHRNGLGAARGLSHYLYEQLSRADVFVMMNESRIFRRGGSVIQFVGVEDYWSDRYDPPLAFEMVNRHMPTIALCHNPDAAMEVSRLGADWVLSGHTHGMSLPVSRLGNIARPTENDRFTAGQYNLDDGKFLYVNRGLGYGRRWKRRARPEITLFTLRSA